MIDELNTLDHFNGGRITIPTIFFLPLDRRKSETKRETGSRSGFPIRGRVKRRGAPSLLRPSPLISSAIATVVSRRGKKERETGIGMEDRWAWLGCGVGGKNKINNY